MQLKVDAGGLGDFAKRLLDGGILCIACFKDQKRRKIKSMFPLKRLAVEQQQLCRTAFARAFPAEAFCRKQEMQALDLSDSEIRQFLGDLERARKWRSFGSLRPKLLEPLFSRARNSRSG